MKIKTIIFDIAGVLVGFDWTPFFQKYYGDDTILIERMRDTLFRHGIWSELDRGVWSDEEIIQGFLHISPDLEKELLLSGSAQTSLWGINLYPDADDEDFIEFDSLINIRPRQGNMSRDVESEEIRNAITRIVTEYIKR